MHHLWTEGYDVVGFDAIEENIQVSKELHPEIADRVFVASLEEVMPFEDASFDFVLCNAVIQHIDSETVQQVVLPELSRVLCPNGVLQLMFKNGQDVLTMFDKDYGVERNFQLHAEQEVLKLLQLQGMNLVEAESPDQLGGLMYFTDGKAIDHCLLFARKEVVTP